MEMILCMMSNPTVVAERILFSFSCSDFMLLPSLKVNSHKLKHLYFDNLQNRFKLDVRGQHSSHHAMCPENNLSTSEE